MAVTANPHATDAAVEILKNGGNALDAAIAAQWVLNLVEPQSSGIGGGGFLLFRDATANRIRAWDGREAAPRSIRPEFALRTDGTPRQFLEILGSGNAVGVPGLVAMLEAAHRESGKVKWEALFAPAIRLAKEGFPVSPRLHLQLRDDPLMRRDAAAFALYYERNGDPKAVGSPIKNLDLAETLRRISKSGSVAVYEGEIAEKVSKAVEERGGSLTPGDLRAYRPKEREPLCGAFRHWRVCGMPAPSSGGLAVLQILGIVASSTPVSLAPESADAAHLFSEAGRLAFADRSRYVGDPDYVAVPQRELVSALYLQKRASLIEMQRAMGTALPGDLEEARSQADGDELELPSTTHISVVDAEGNAVAMTSSIESAFGSRIQVAGFLLNNELTDFALSPLRNGKPVANSAAPGKRPMSSMAPTLVFDEQDRLIAVLGSPGGSRIINFVARSLLAILDAEMDPATVLGMGHIGNRNGLTEVEHGRVPPEIGRELVRRGHSVQEADMTSGLHVIVMRNGAWVGAADPRREGMARGE